MGERKNSFDDVLQWLFRDQPSSPPPCISGKGQRKQTLDCDPSLASLQFLDSPTDQSRIAGVPISSHLGSSTPLTAQSSPMHMCHQQQPQQQHCHINQQQSLNNAKSPSNCSDGSITDGFGAQCGLHSPRDPAAPFVLQQHQHQQHHQRQAQHHQQQQQQSRDDSAMRPLDNGGRPTDSARRLSALPASDAVALSSSRMGLTDRATSDLFASMSAPGHPSGASGVQQHQKPIGYDPIICDDIQWEEPDLTGLAPFVDNTEMEQITEGLPPELQHLFSMPDWTPAEPLIPAARPVQLEKSKGSMSPPAKKHQMSDSRVFFPAQQFGGQLNTNDCRQPEETSYWPWQEQEQMTPFGSTFPQEYINSQQQPQQQ